MWQTKQNKTKTSLPWWLRQESICLQCGRPGFNPWVGKISWRRKWQRTPVFLSRESQGWRSLVGYSPWGRRESDTTERLHFTSLHRYFIFCFLVALYLHCFFFPVFLSTICLGGFLGCFSQFPLFLFHVSALDLCFVITMRFEKISHR